MEKDSVWKSPNGDRRRPLSCLWKVLCINPHFSPFISSLTGKCSGAPWHLCALRWCPLWKCRMRSLLHNSHVSHAGISSSIPGKAIWLGLYSASLASADLTTTSSSQTWELVTPLSIFCPAIPTLSEHVVSELNSKWSWGVLLGVSVEESTMLLQHLGASLERRFYPNVYCRRNWAALGCSNQPVTWCPWSMVSTVCVIFLFPVILKDFPEKSGLPCSFHSWKNQCSLELSENWMHFLARENAVQDKPAPDIHILG